MSEIFFCKICRKNFFVALKSFFEKDLKNFFASVLPGHHKLKFLCYNQKNFLIGGNFMSEKVVTCPQCWNKMSTNRSTCPYCGAFFTGTVNGIAMNTAKSYVEEKFHGARGHGFAAESANDLFDRMTGKDAKIVGGDNAKDGSDRIVNGQNIQSKYCSSGSKCIQECFRDGKFRYYNPDGSQCKLKFLPTNMTTQLKQCKIESTEEKFAA